MSNLASARLKTNQLTPVESAIVADLVTLEMSVARLAESMDRLTAILESLAVIAAGLMPDRERVVAALNAAGFTSNTTDEKGKG